MGSDPEKLSDMVTAQPLHREVEELYHPWDGGEGV
jgi:hypothetical protein